MLGCQEFQILEPVLNAVRLIGISQKNNLFFYLHMIYIYDMLNVDKGTVNQQVNQRGKR
jgi:hypothetical protein